MAFPGEIGWIGKNCPDHNDTKLVTFIGRSNAGHFVATRCPKCQEPHFSRESGYYDSAEDVYEAVDADRVRWRDAMYAPTKNKLLAELKTIFEDAFE